MNKKIVIIIIAIIAIIAIAVSAVLIIKANSKTSVTYIPKFVKEYTLSLSYPKDKAYTLTSDDKYIETSTIEQELLGDNFKIGLEITNYYNSYDSLKESVTKSQKDVYNASITDTTINKLEGFYYDDFSYDAYTLILKIDDKYYLNVTVQSTGSDHKLIEDKEEDAWNLKEVQDIIKTFTINKVAE